MAQGCFPIDAAWGICPGLSGFLLDPKLSTNISSLTGQFFTGEGNASFRFVENFNSYFDLQKQTIPNGYQNASFSAAFSSLHGCPGYTHYHRRYLKSIWCMLLIASSLSQCPSQGTLLPLCRASCDVYANTTIETLRNQTQCPPNETAMMSLQDAERSTTSLCNNALFNGLPPNCFSGDYIEPQNCGYIVGSRQNPSSLCSKWIPNSPEQKPISNNFLVFIAIICAAVLIIICLFVLKKKKKKEKEQVKRVSSIVSSMSSVSKRQTLYTVVRDYEPKMEDELHLRVGDIIKVEDIFDDGWAIGTSRETKKQGIFPLTFVSKQTNIDHDVVDVSKDKGLMRPTVISEY